MVSLFFEFFTSLNFESPAKAAANSAFALPHRDATLVAKITPQRSRVFVRARCLLRCSGMHLLRTLALERGDVSVFGELCHIRCVGLWILTLGLLLDGSVLNT